MTFWEGRRPSWLPVHKPDAVEVADWAQHAKTALAGVIAWVIAVDVLGLDQPFLAPWAARRFGGTARADPGARPGEGPRGRPRG